MQYSSIMQLVAKS